MTFRPPVPLPENRGVPGSSPGLAIRRNACQSATSRRRSMVFRLAATCHNVSRSPKRSPKLERRAGPYTHDGVAVPGRCYVPAPADRRLGAARASRSGAVLAPARHARGAIGARITSPRSRRSGVLDPRDSGSAGRAGEAPVGWMGAAKGVPHRRHNTAADLSIARATRRWLAARPARGWPRRSGEEVLRPPLCGMKGGREERSRLSCREAGAEDASQDGCDFFVPSALRRVHPPPSQPTSVVKRHAQLADAEMLGEAGSRDCVRVEHRVVRSLR